MSIWPSGLRRWNQDPVRKGVSSNLTVDTDILFVVGIQECLLQQCTRHSTQLSASARYRLGTLHPSTPPLTRSQQGLANTWYTLWSSQGRRSQWTICTPGVVVAMQAPHRCLIMNIPTKRIIGSTTVGEDLSTTL